MTTTRLRFFTTLLAITTRFQSHEPRLFQPDGEASGNAMNQLLWINASRYTL